MPGDAYYLVKSTSATRQTMSTGSGPLTPGGSDQGSPLHLAEETAMPQALTDRALSVPVAVSPCLRPKDESALALVEGRGYPPVSPSPRHCCPAGAPRLCACVCAGKVHGGIAPPRLSLVGRDSGLGNSGQLEPHLAQPTVRDARLLLQCASSPGRMSFALVNVLRRRRSCFLPPRW
jgi:hypothetical protein